MNTINYSSAREKLATLMNNVCNDHEPIIVTRNGDQSVVMLSLDDYKSLEETSYLLRSPKNVRILLASIDELNCKNGIVKDIAL